MATKKRERSETGFYHVYQRGVSLFDIFEDDGDREFYLDRLEKYTKENGVEVHAWCLMSNHTHLLVRGDLEALSAAMRQLGSVYARYFNFRHLRSGPLFEGRFCSVAVQSETQFVNVIRYIHRNPVYHDETARIASWPWSSYRNHVEGAPGFCVTSVALSIFGSVKEFVEFHENREGDGHRYLDIDTTGPMRDDEARKLANEVLSHRGFTVSTSLIGRLPREKRNKALCVIRETVGCSLRQLQRLTAIAYSAIRKALEAPVEAECEAVDTARTELSRSLDSLVCYKHEHSPVDSTKCNIPAGWKTGILGNW